MGAIKSLISQARQIKSSESYKDQNYIDGSYGNRELPSDMHSVSVAEGAVFIEDDLNYLRTQIKEIIGKDNWYDKSPISLEALKGMNTKTLIQPVQISNVVFSEGESLLNISSGSASSANSTLPGFVFANSVTDLKAKVIVRDIITNMPIISNDENQVFGIMFFEGLDGAQIGTEPGNRLKVKLFEETNGVILEYVKDITAEILIPQRVNILDTAEDYAMLNAGFANSVGSIEIGDRMWVSLNPETGLYDMSTEQGDNTHLNINTNDDITKVINSIIKESSTANTVASKNQEFLGINLFSDGSFSTDLNMLWDGEGVSTHYLKHDSGSGDKTVIDGFKRLDNELKTFADILEATTVQKHAVLLENPIASGTEIILPDNQTVTINDKNALDILLNGQRLTSDLQISGLDGNNTGDYYVSSNNGITFNFDLEQSDVIVMDIYKS